MTIYKRYFPMVHIIGQGTETRYDYLGTNSLYNKTTIPDVPQDSPEEPQSQKPIESTEDTGTIFQG